MWADPFRVLRSPASGVGECLIDDCQRLIDFNEVDFGDAEKLAQFLRRYLHWSWRGCFARLGLWESRRARGVERHVAFDLLHDLMNVPVQDRYRAKALDE